MKPYFLSIGLLFVLSCVSLKPQQKGETKAFSCNDSGEFEEIYIQTLDSMLTYEVNNLRACDYSERDYLMWIPVNDTMKVSGLSFEWNNEKTDLRIGIDSYDPLSSTDGKAEISFNYQELLSTMPHTIYAKWRYRNGRIVIHSFQTDREFRIPTGMDGYNNSNYVSHQIIKQSTEITLTVHAK